ncbi:MAG TPA: glycosyltransferase [Herpetosiphonaceae bacterium]
MTWLWRIAAALLLGQRVWKHWLVRRFFRRPIPPQRREPALVSVLQPILSGDPTLRACLAANLAAPTRYRREFVWLIDQGDDEAAAICAELSAAYPAEAVQIIALPPPGPRDNPKTVKLWSGLRHAGGDVICVLDDDTMLPPAGLEQCLPFLDQPGVGLAFGLPYYRCFANVWSALVSLFVNSQSLLTYVPYTALTEPFTINGMFYAMRREVLDKVGGFGGLEAILADDFAVARRFRAAGYRLAQTPLRHGISTYVHGPGHYLSLLQRWFIFPRESLMRHLSARELAVLYGLGLAPALFPLAAAALLVRPSRGRAAYAALYFGYGAWLARQIDRDYLGQATPRGLRWAAPLIEIIFPVQLLGALCSPQRINWRGHVMRVERGGTFEFVRRRRQ